jgi:NADH dehydrogenase (ubiquinone) Fe-S protein 8
MVRNGPPIRVHASRVHPTDFATITIVVIDISRLLPISGKGHRVVLLPLLQLATTMVAPLARHALAAGRSASAAFPSRLAAQSIAARPTTAALQQARMISFSPFRRLAQPTTSSGTQSGPIRTPHPAESSLASAASPGSRQQAPAEAPASIGGLAHDDYSKGPSALDKAAQLFFFTEILRGLSLLR